MERRRSPKKTRSCMGTPTSSLSPASGDWPQHRERVKPASLGILHPGDYLQEQHKPAESTSIGGSRGLSQALEPPSSTLTPQRSSASVYPGSSSQRDSGSPQITRTTSKQIHGLPFENDGKSGIPTVVQEVSIAVLGAPAVGKSTFIHCALDLKKPSTSHVSSKKVSLEGKISVVRLYELALEDVEVTPEESVHWPERVEDEIIPCIDGVLAIYDVINQGSISPIPNLLSELVRSFQVLHSSTAGYALKVRSIPSTEALVNDSIPTVVVSAKCDSPFNMWEIDQEKVEKFCNTLNVESFQTSITAPETHKRCISVILRNIMLERRQLVPEAECASRSRALTTPQFGPTSPRVQATGAKGKHSRAASEVLNSASTACEPSSTSLSHVPIDAPYALRTSDRPVHQKGLNQRSDEQRSPASRVAEEGSDEGRASTHRSKDAQSAQEVDNVFDISPKPYHSATFNTPAIAKDTMKGRYVDEGPTDARDGLSAPSEASSENTEDAPLQEIGPTFDDLVDRLLSQTKSKPDAKFAAVFLCLYRKFAPPYTLLTAIVRRFEDLNDKDTPYLTRMTAQLRYLNILKDWISDYPGDFAHPMTRRFMTGFVQGLASYQEFAVAIREISPHLDVVSDDDDTEWAYSDKSRSRTNTMESFLTMSSVASTASMINGESPTLTADSSTEDIVDRASSEKISMSRPSRISATPSSTSSMSRTDSQSTTSFQTLIFSVENAQCQARFLAPVPRNPLTKIQWHQFIEMPEEQVACELTRIDWIMYSSIRPRDLIRDVSLAPEQKEKCTSLEHVNRMVQHFNHVAYWVANMILLRDKPKHRAKALEKFMGVAWKLRHLNNYNSLGAVVAGINGTAVHRLTQTRELIPPQSQKEFMRLEILMGTQKSHFAYRLAYSNTSTARIPFLPLHRRDLVLAEQGNKTHIGVEANNRINWKKFEVMGEVIISIRQSQQIVYPHVSRNEEVRQMVLEGRFCKDDDRLWARSIQLEAHGIGETSRKKFNWFQR